MAGKLAARAFSRMMSSNGALMGDDGARLLDEIDATPGEWEALDEMLDATGLSLVRGRSGCWAVVSSSTSPWKPTTSALSTRLARRQGRLDRRALALQYLQTQMMLLVIGYFYDPAVSDTMRTGRTYITAEWLVRETGALAASWAQGGNEVLVACSAIWKGLRAEKSTGRGNSDSKDGMADRVFEVLSRPEYGYLERQPDTESGWRPTEKMDAVIPAYLDRPRWKAALETVASQSEAEKGDEAEEMGD